jgi:hypothetical protein
LGCISKDKKTMFTRETKEPEGLSARQHGQGHKEERLKGGRERKRKRENEREREREMEISLASQGLCT